MNRNTLRGYLVVLKATVNCADAKLNEPVEPDLFFSSIKNQK